MSYLIVFISNVLNSLATKFVAALLAGIPFFNSPGIAQNQTEPDSLCSNELQVTPHSGSTTLEFSNGTLPTDQDCVSGVQVRIHSDMFHSDGTPRFSVDFSSSWLFSGASVGTTIQEEDAEGFIPILFQLPEEDCDTGTGTLFILDFSQVYPEGIDNEGLEALEGGGGCIIVLVDVM